MVVVIVATLALAASSCSIVENRRAIRRICEGLNEGRAINNRDRLTLLRGARNAEASAATVSDPTLKRLLLDSVKTTRAEIAVRPYLDRIAGCSAPVPFPLRDLPPD